MVVEMCGKTEPRVDARRTVRRARRPQETAAGVGAHPQPLPLELQLELTCGADLPRVGGRLLLEYGGREGAADDQLAMVAPGEEEVRPPRRNAGGQREGDGGTADPPAADGAHRLLHRDGRATAALGMATALEEDEHGVPTELQDVAAELLRVAKDVPEHGVDRVRQLLGADPAAPGEPLAQHREARDVGEQQRRVELLPGAAGVARQPSAVDGGEVGLGPGDRGVSRQCRARAHALTAPA
jgi:hypothetical protein